MIWLTIILIFGWYGLTGIREGLEWSKPGTQLFKYNKYDWSTFNIIYGVGLFIGFAMYIKFVILFLPLYMLSVFTRNKFSENHNIKGIYKIDYHGFRAIEGLAMFSLFWLVSKDLLIVSISWIFGNYVYKKIMNKIMFNNWFHISNIKVFWLFGLGFTYSDWYYELSLIVGIGLLFLI